VAPELSEEVDFSFIAGLDQSLDCEPDLDKLRTNGGRLIFRHRDAQAKHPKSSVITLIAGRMTPGPGTKYGLLQEWPI
jgi:hypothetical protein